MTERLDRFGAVASSVCAVHCAVCALLPAAFAAFGLGVLLGHEAEWVFTIIAVLCAGAALGLGWQRHRSPHVALMLLLGISGLLASRGLEAGDDHDDHDGHHGAAVHHGEHDGESHVQRREHHDEAGHAVGTAVGVFGGLLLVSGHILNIHTTRRCRNECCP